MKENALHHCLQRSSTALAGPLSLSCHTELILQPITEEGERSKTYTYRSMHAHIILIIQETKKLVCKFS